MKEKIKTAVSQADSVEIASRELREQLKATHPEFVVCFAQPNCDLKNLVRGLEFSFPEAEVIGCTTAGELVSGRMLEDSIVAMAFSSEIIADVAVEEIRNINSRPVKKIEQAFENFADYYQEPVEEMDYNQYVGLVLVDGLSGAKTKIMNQINELTDVKFVGGAAGDNLNLADTYVFTTQRVYRREKASTKSVVLALFKPQVEFDILTTQSVEATDQTLQVTKVDTKQNKVIEFNNRPAVEAYAKAVGCKEEEVEDYFLHHPVGLTIDGELYVRSPQQVSETSIVFYDKLKEGREVTLLETTDIITDTEQALAEQNFELDNLTGDIEGIINFNSVLRTLELKEKGQVPEYEQLFSEIPTVGFNTYGELFTGFLNQTAVMLLLGS